MRLNRGSGVGGLAGIRRVNGRVLRPLLDWRRAELEAIVAEAGLEPIIDPSNRDEKFDQARLRRELEGAAWLDRLAAAQARRRSPRRRRRSTGPRSGCSLSVAASRATC